MFKEGTRNPWTLSQDTNETLDFCFYVLQKDGLSSPPFDRHPDGDGSLRALGMTSESWHTWFIAVLQLLREQDRALQQWAHARRSDAQASRPPLDERLWQPASLWNGAPTVAQQLQELWDLYQHRAGTAKELRDKRLLRSQQGQKSINLWSALRPYHHRIPPLKAYIIHYPGGVDLVFPPDTVLLSDSGLDQTTIRDSLLRAASVLADGGEHSWHRPIDPQTEQQREQRIQDLASAAQTLGPAEDPDPLTAIRKQLHRNFLGEYEWNFATLRINKQKRTAMYQISIITIQDTKGKRYTFSCTATRKPDGLWQALSCSSGPPPWHPLLLTLLQRVLQTNQLWLWYQAGSGLVYSTDSTPKNGFISSGELSTLGRKIVRVRLIDALGELGEDTVENGLLLITNERQMQTPLYAEFYDRAGKMVRRQTLIERHN